MRHSVFRLRRQPAWRARRGDATALSERARLDGADREQHFRRREFQVESSRVGLVRTALLGALRFHAGSGVPAKEGLPGAQGGNSILGGPPGGAGRWSTSDAGWLEPGAWTGGTRRDLRSGNRLGSFHQLHGGCRRVGRGCRVPAEGGANAGETVEAENRRVGTTAGVAGRPRRYSRRAPPRVAPLRLASGTPDIAGGDARTGQCGRSEEHTSELQSLRHLVCRLL